MRYMLKFKRYHTKWAKIEALDQFSMSLRQINVFYCCYSICRRHLCEILLHFAIVTLLVVIFRILICVMLLWAFYRFRNVHIYKNNVYTHAICNIRLALK